MCETFSSLNSKVRDNLSTNEKASACSEQKVCVRVCVRSCCACACIFLVGIARTKPVDQ